MKNGTIPPLWRENLVHMLGVGNHINKKLHGYRNRFCVNTAEHNEDYQSMVGMMEAGLVVPGEKINGGATQFFHATKAGCKAIGLSEAVTKRALEN